MLYRLTTLLPLVVLLWAACSSTPAEPTYEEIVEELQIALWDTVPEWLVLGEIINDPKKGRPNNIRLVERLPWDDSLNVWPMRIAVGGPCEVTNWRSPVRVAFEGQMLVHVAPDTDRVEDTPWRIILMAVDSLAPADTNLFDDQAT